MCVLECAGTVENNAIVLDVPWYANEMEESDLKSVFLDARWPSNPV